MAPQDQKRQKTGDSPGDGEGPSHPKEDFSLQPHGAIKTPSQDKPFLLVVLDGWGEAPDADDNAISRAKTPTMDKLREARHFSAPRLALLDRSLHASDLMAAPTQRALLILVMQDASHLRQTTGRIASGPGVPCMHSAPQDRSMPLHLMPAADDHPRMTEEHRATSQKPWMQRRARIEVWWRGCRELRAGGAP